ncbi:AMIN-like domain-containing (lipo)protein [Amycolatopsis sp. NPDC003861]
MTPRGRAVLVALACGLAVAGCGSDRAAAPPASTSPSASVLPAPATTPVTTPAAPTTSVPPTATPPPAKAVCPETAGWRTDARDSDPMSRDALYLVRAGRHACFDRVVFDVNGPAAGFAVRYVPVVTTDPKGEPLPVPGGAALQIVVRAPALGTDDSGHQPGRVLAVVGDTLVSTPGWPSLRAVRFAGSFEGLSTFAAGVRARLPFRVFTQLGPQDQVRRVVVDIAH